MARRRKLYTPREKARAAIQILQSPSDESAADTTGLTLKDVARLKRRFISRAHRVFLPSELELAISGLAAGRPTRSLTAFQAGANDGKDDDPIFALIQRHFGKIVLVEPQARLIPKLRQTYSNFPGEAIIENVAIGEPGHLELHIPSDEVDRLYAQKMRRTASAIVSSDREYVIDRVMNGTGLDRTAAEAQISVTKVPSVSIEDLASRHLPEGVDLLQVDCEGYDWLVLKTLGTIRPAIINFEANKLPKDHWVEWQTWAETNGYGYVSGSRDTLAIRGAVFS